MHFVQEYLINIMGIHFLVHRLTEFKRKEETVIPPRVLDNKNQLLHSKYPNRKKSGNMPAWEFADKSAH